MMRAIRGVLMLLGVLAAVPGAAAAADAKGDWVGALEISAAAKLRLVVHIKGADGDLQGTMDSIDQGAFGIPLAEIAASATSLDFAVPAIAGRYEGQWDEARKAWVGQWSQGGASMPLTLTSPPPPAPLPANWAIPADREIGALLDQRIAARPGAGMVAGVIEPLGRRLVARGPVGATRFDGDTVFEIGSMSKVFTALLLADMVERGEVALDDPAEKYLPAGVRMPARGTGKITLADLATHRSALPRLPTNLPMSDMDDPYADYTEAQLLEFLSTYQLTRDIGSQYEYSNLGMGLLGYLLARRAGVDYETLLRTRITGPLGMKDSAISLSPALKARFAQGHDMYMRPAKPWDIAVLAGAGGIRSTVNDLLLFLEAAIGTRETPLAPAIKAMLAKRWPAADPRFETGLGWLVAKSPSGEIVMHDGGTGGFRTSMAYDPVKRRGIVLLSNSAVEPSTNDLAIHMLVGSPVAPVRPIPPAPKPLILPAAIRLPPAELDRVVGRYEFGPGLALDVTRDGDRLMAQITSQPRFPILAEAPLKFFWTVVDARIRFVADAEGKVTEAILTQGGADMFAKRVTP